MTEVRLSEDLATCLEIRRVVFTLEQGVSEADEVDGQDPEAVHFLAFDKGEPIGTARVLMSETSGKIGRVAVLKSARGMGAGQALIRTAVNEIARRGLREAVLGSQVSAIGFYEKLGFAARGPEFMDAGIPHREMVRSL